MGDLGPLVEALLPVARDVLGPVLRAMLRTAAGVAVLVVCVTLGCYGIASNGDWRRGAMAAAVGFIITAACGGLVMAKRTALFAAQAALQKARLGHALLSLVFERLMGVDSMGTFTQRGGSLAQTVENLPLAQAEARLRDVVDNLLKAPPAGGGMAGWIRRVLTQTLLRRVEAITLAEFRVSGTAKGGVDLAVAQKRLAESVDSRILRGMDAAMLKVTVILASLACLVSLAAAWALRAF